MSSNKKPVPANKAKTPAPAAKPVVKMPFVFTRMNYILTAACLIILVIGFMLMSGSKGNIYDFRRITLAPIVVILGFLLGFVAIFYKEKNTKDSDHGTA